jgi:hypothetical protein
MIKSSRLFMLSVLLFAANCAAQQVSTSQQPPQQPKPNDQAQFFQLATNGSIFVYGSGADPCAAPPPGTTLLPLGSGFVAGIEKSPRSSRSISRSRTLGSGFVAGIEKSGASKPGAWNGWKFLVTAKYVLANRADVTIRVNSEDGSKFVCKTITLELSGTKQNVVLAPDGVDLAAVALPEIPDCDPTVVSSSLLTDEAKMKEWNIGVGTEVLTIGYLYGFSGLQSNYPVAKFGRISLITEEPWYFNPESRLMEKGYVLDLSNAPGLSGAPVFTHGVEFETDPFRYRSLPPVLIGVVKGLMLVPVNGQLISQGIAVIEPGENLRALMVQIAAMLKAGGADVVEIS